MSKYSIVINIVTKPPNILGNKGISCIKLFTVNKIVHKRYSKRPDSKEPSKAEQIDATKIPGFVNPNTMHEEGYFTQQAKQQLEELKKRMDKPKVENTERKE